MSKPDQNTKKSPAQQTGEEHGSIKSAQQTDRHMPEPDLARGSEVETRAAARNRN